MDLSVHRPQYQQRAVRSYGCCQKWGSPDVPDLKEMAAFDQFVVQLAQRLSALQAVRG
jgi:hypothetical protein